MQKSTFWGAVLSLACAATYVVGIILLVTSLSHTGYLESGADPHQTTAFLVANADLMLVWYLTIYVVNGIALAGLAAVLSHVFQPQMPVLAKLVFGFGFLWATLVVAAGMVATVGLAAVVETQAVDPRLAAQLWHIVTTIESGLGGGNEIAGAVWATVISIAIWRGNQMPTALASLGFALGVCGGLTLFPMCADIAGAVFGIGYILWFIWIGVILLRCDPSLSRHRPCPTH